MRERVTQLLLGLGCAALAGCAGHAKAAVGATTAPTTSSTTNAITNPSTQPARIATTTPAVVQPTTAVPPVKHEPVPPPPLSPGIPQAPPPPPDAVVATPPSSQRTPPPAVAPTTQPGPIADPVAYAMGYAAGARIRARLNEDGRPADNLQVISGMIAGLDDHDPSFPREQMQAAFAQFQAYSLQRRAEKQYASDPAFRKLADENLQKSRAFMAQGSQLANFDVLPDGVLVSQVKPGAGRILGTAKFITVNLKISLADGTLVRATEPGKPERIAVEDCLQVVIDASRAMKVGGIWRVLLPPDKAYGLAGKLPVIGPNESIEYEIELINAE